MKVQFEFRGGAIQEKVVISHATFTEIIKPSREELYILSQKKKVTDEEENRIVKLKEILKGFEFEWCTDESILGQSVITEILDLPINQGGPQNVKITIL